MEREHKFLVEDSFPEIAHLQDAYAARGLELRLSTPRDQTDVYYDTPEFTLLQAGAALRVRRYGDEVLATYKTSGVVQGSLHVREEIELPYSAPWPPKILAKLAPLGVLETLEPLVQLRTRRIRYLVYDAPYKAQNPLAELSLDDVSCSHGAKQMAFKELELEAIPTLPDAAFSDLAAILGTFGLSPHRGDKVSHALTLLGLWPRTQTVTRQL